MEGQYVVEHESLRRTTVAPELYKLFPQCTVRVSTPTGHGTGFFVAPGLILTCAHVINTVLPETITLIIAGHNCTVHIQHRVDETDLALLHVDFTDHPCVLLDKEDVIILAPLMSYGYPDDYPEGDTSTYEFEGLTEGSLRLLKFKGGEVRPGMSGSPLLNLQTGKVCGVVKRTRGEESMLGGRAIPMDTVLHAIAELVAEQEQFHLKDRRWLSCLASSPVLFSRQERASPIRNLPYQRNLCFTGREDILVQIHTGFLASPQPQAISGLGGVGKTQIAVEYAYRYANDYEEVLWVGAEKETLTSEFLALARLLNLPEKDDQDQSRPIAAVRHWLMNHQRWLLVFDNVEDLGITREFFPLMGAGHILLTTRAQATEPIARSIDVEKMEVDEGALFLLRRANLIARDARLEDAPAADRTEARKIVQIMDGLPLALDQAAAYMYEVQYSLADYLELYQAQQAELLNLRGNLPPDHSESVTTTLSLSFQKVEKIQPIAKDLLRLCAFLSPDAIPEELFMEKVSYPGSTLQAIAINVITLNSVISELRKYSLIRRNAETKTLTIHRLVQTVLKNSMDEATQRQWVEHIVRILAQVFPSREVAPWPQCRRYLPHALVCGTLITQWDLAFAEAASLLHHVGFYLYKRAQYTEARPLYEQALAMRQHILGLQHPDTAASINGLATLYRDQGKYDQARSLYEQALDIRQHILGLQHPDTATSINGLATLYNREGWYDQAERLYQQALDIRQQTLGPDHPDTAQSLNNLASLYRNQARYALAEPLYQQALDIRRRVLGNDHPDTASSLDNLAGLYRRQDKYDQAESLCQEALDIRKRALGPDHPDTAASINDLALLYYDQHKYDQAESLYQEALDIRKRALDPDHPDIAQSLNNLANLYSNQDKYDQAELLYQQALAIREQVLGNDHPSTVSTRNKLASLYRRQGKSEQTNQLYQQTLERFDKALTAYEQAINRDPSYGRAYSGKGNVLRNLRRFDEALLAYEKAIQLNPNYAPAYSGKGLTLRALKRYKEALAAFEQAIALNPDTADYFFNNKGLTLRALKRPKEALAAFEQAIALNPDTADYTNNRGAALNDLKRYEEALAAYEQAILLNPNVALYHNNRGNTLRVLKRPEEALTAYEQAIALNPDTADYFNNKGLTLRELKRPEEALAAFEQAIVLNPDSADYTNNKGTVLDDLKRYEEALAAYEQAILLNPNVALYHNNKGRRLRALKRPEEALAAFEQAIQLDPNYASAYNGRGLALQSLKRFDEALAAFDQAITFSPNNADYYNNKGNLLLRHVPKAHDPE